MVVLGLLGFFMVPWPWGIEGQSLRVWAVHAFTMPDGGGGGQW